MSHSQGNGKIYEELRGYFPPEYDLTPEELEKEIEIENKKREIALGMMRTRFADERAEAERIAARHAQISAQAQKAVAQAPEEKEEEPSPAPVATVQAPVPTEPEEDISEPVTPTEETAPDITAAPESDTVDIPEACDVTDNELLKNYDPLDELFEELEDQSADDTDEGDSGLRKTVNWFFDLLEVFSICIACIIVVFALFFRLTKVSGESMEDTLYENEYLVVSDLFYEPAVGDIVVIQNTSLTNDLLKEPLVKRIIAVGGQSVNISSNGMVTLTREDGTTEILDQQFIKKQPYTGISGHYDVPEGYVFVMGDNRNHSTDSRSPMVGLVDERCIFGKALLRVLPFETFTVFENPYND